jgi:NAD(P)-dependent dehydrogenase (short-subunit alcohol dehydrogenase family)
MKTIFITGTSTGLGKAAAKLFASNDWRVIATMRNPEKEEELNNLDNVSLLALDVTDPGQITSAVKTACSMGKIDVVFNNAGYGLMGPLEATPVDNILNQINTNLVGPIRIIKEFIPHFRANNGGLFITTTSIGGLVTFPFSSIYHAAKWGMEGFSESLAFELAQFGILVKTISPGGVATDFAGRSMVLNQHEAYEKDFGKMLNVLSGGGGFEFSTAESIAEVIYEAATDGKDQIRYVAGPDAKQLYENRLTEGTETFRKEMAKMLLG